MPKPDAREWTPELETALLRALRAEVAYANRTHFHGRLRAPALRLTDTQVLGRWIASERTIELSRPLVCERPWIEVTDVLRHEMAHQFVEEVLGVLDEPPHGPTFRRVCAERAIDARAAGDPDGAQSDPETARMLEKVRKLLALAGSENQHEAELAMRRAQELMLKHQLALHPDSRRYVSRQLGTPALRKSSAESSVGGLLAAHFFVEVIWLHVHMPHLGRSGRVLEVSGTPETVELAEYVHAFLMRTAVRLFADARARQPGLRGADRSAFMAGVIRGFRDKLDGARCEHTGAGLVWVGDAGLQQYFDARYPRRRTTTRGATSRWAAHQLGRSEGRNVVLHRPIESGGRGGTKLLPG
jgi:hypothetical protein